MKKKSILRRLFLISLVMISCQLIAGNVKIVKTGVQSVNYDLEGMYVSANVQVELADVKEGECACFIFMNNGHWKDSNLSLDELSELCQKICVGHAFIPETHSSSTQEIEIEIPFAKEYLSGTDSVLYLKAYVVSGKTKSIIAEGDLIKYTPDVSAIRSDMMESAFGIASSIFGAILGAGASGGRGQIPEGHEACSRCRGTGECQACNGSGWVGDDHCPTCYGTKECQLCGGKGYRSGF